MKCFYEHFRELHYISITLHKIVDKTGFEIVFCRVCENSLSDISELKSKIRGVISNKAWEAEKNHEKIKIGVSACPNACSAPQIKDFGVIAFIKPKLIYEKCMSCGECFRACRERAISFSFNNSNEKPTFLSSCIGCGDCMRACKFNAITGDVYFKVIAGGKLGRHPKFAEEVLITKKVDIVIEVLKIILDISIRAKRRFSYVKNSLMELRKRLIERQILQDR